MHRICFRPTEQKLQSNQAQQHTSVPGSRNYTQHPHPTPLEQDQWVKLAFNDKLWELFNALWKTRQAPTVRLWRWRLLWWLPVCLTPKKVCSLHASVAVLTLSILSVSVFYSCLHCPCRAKFWRTIYAPPTFNNAHYIHRYILSYVSILNESGKITFSNLRQTKWRGLLFVRNTNSHFLLFFSCSQIGPFKLCGLKPKALRDFPDVSRKASHQSRLQSKKTYKVSLDTRFSKNS